MREQINAHMKGYTMKYYSLIVRDRVGTAWSIEFGDYDRHIVSYERGAVIPQYSQGNTRIMVSADGQLDILAELNKINAMS